MPFQFGCIFMFMYSWADPIRLQIVRVHQAWTAYNVISGPLFF